MPQNISNCTTCGRTSEVVDMSRCPFCTISIQWKEEWKEFYGLYGDIGRSEEDIKVFITQTLQALATEMMEAKTTKAQQAVAKKWGLV